MPGRAPHLVHQVPGGSSLISPLLPTSSPLPTCSAPAAALCWRPAALPAQPLSVQSPLSTADTLKRQIAAALAESGCDELRIAALGADSNGEAVSHDAPLAFNVGRGFADAESAECRVGVAGDDAATTDQAPRGGDGQ